ncbi:carbohydrate ABC transporter membrane protein 1 (CUT1 family) [Kribbella amoyensis]|uniref:Carbohydrate ABC transporter membrane protein 1 (CUT1 family) n=1 Tax=Kribbella amoyensis TaxID=996641 RepID=A0A561BNB9_9ACTN|nr:sugar ABC transporter permease [Kribbella amoyensis]TWD80334.1 carbohydrate ABC transporter membrane protein 1 (CUT1 family) [Kribbella amoyensis]
MHGRIRTWGPGALVLLPTVLLLGYFVYGLIAWTFNTSLTDRHTARKGPAEYVGLENYVNLFGEERFLNSLKNLGVLTVSFIVGTLVFGVLWALLLEKGVTGEGVFRSIFLFPMAISMIASGVVWGWLLNPSQGEEARGLNRLFSIVGLNFLENPWWTAGSRWTTMAAIALPAVWQLSGYIMALFLAGFRGIPPELREAARVDGASEFKLYRHVLFPQLSPIALSALIILGHMSLKLFDLIYAITGPNQFRTEVPSIYMWNTLLRSDMAKAAAIAIVLLAVVAVLVIPYVAYTVRQESEK